MRFMGCLGSTNFIFLLLIALLGANNLALRADDKPASAEVQNLQDKLAKQEADQIPTDVRTALNIPIDEIRPTQEELALGLLITTWTVASSFAIWHFGDVEISNNILLTSFQGAIALTFNGGLRAFDKFFSSEWMPVVRKLFERHPEIEKEAQQVWKEAKGPEKVSKKVEFFRRIAMNWVLLEVIRGMSGAVGMGASVYTLTGQFEIFMNILTTGVGASFVALMRNRTFADNPVTTTWVNFMAFLPLSIVSAADGAGLHLARLAELDAFGQPMYLNLSTVIVAASYLTAGLIITGFPKKIEKLAYLHEKAIRPLIVGGSQTLKSSLAGCRKALGRVFRPTRPPLTKMD